MLSLRFLSSFLGALLFMGVAFAAPSKALLAKSTATVSTVINPAGKKAGVELKSFREWKSEKVKNVMERVDRLKGQIQVSRGKVSASVTNDLEQQLVQERWNLEVAGDLSVTDYLVLYLAQQGQSVPLTEAARKLSPEEIAQVMEAYLRSTGTLPTSAQALSPEAALIGH